MDKDQLVLALQSEVTGYNKIIATEKGDWIVKGFIDVFRNIYTITLDTKVVSKIFELLLIPVLQTFARHNDLILELPLQQNFYPDITFICRKTGQKFAIDIKSTFKDSANKIKSMTLGSFTGYFRDRGSTKNTLYPYGQYSSHLVLGIIYSQIEKSPDERATFKLEDLESIESVIRDFQFFVQPKYKIASAIPGSGNTKNIGSTRIVSKLVNGQGVFSSLGEEIYDDYWKYYLTKDMAKALEIQRPYTNLKSYFEYKQRDATILVEHHEEIEKLSAEDDAETNEMQIEENNDEEL